MTPEQYQKVKKVFQQALELPAAHRPDYLDHACAGDSQVRSQVEQMLTSDTANDSFLDKPAVDPLSKLLEDEPPAPKHVGNYQILKEIGRGGMGAVYLAARADDQYRKQVAIKLVLRDRENAAVLDRFRRERQILANLDHPNIALLLDGGATPEGLPYLVMEFVEGEPIDTYCDRGKLDVTARLKLFLNVCAAVQHAHQNLVIHRDLKPSNVLVKKDGTVKLLDFGIAKILHKQALTQPLEKTAPSMRMLTPEYASPEQVKGEAVTTSTDVYQLGVVLYELLTGHLPFEGRSRAALLQMLANDEPPRPSTAVARVTEDQPSDTGSRRIVKTADIVSQTRGGTPGELRRRLEGDVDAILMRALSRDPAKRYASAEEFADDIRRHLNDLPVQARPYSPPYVASRFLRRHKAWAAAAAAVILTLLGGIAFSAREAHIANLERLKAQHRFDEVRKMANSFLFEVHDAMAPLSGTTAARQLVVRKAMEYLDNLSREAAGDPGLQRELATAYHRVGDLQGNPNNPNLGDSAGARKNYEKALALRKELLRSSPKDRDIRRDLAASHEAIGDLLMTAGDSPGALESYKKAQAIVEELYSEDSANRPVRSLLAKSYHNVIPLLASAGGTTEAIEMGRKALKLSEDLVNEDATNTDARRNVSVAHARFAQVLEVSGDSRGALENFQKALEIQTQLNRANPQDIRTLRDLSLLYEDIGRANAGANNLPEANANYAKALAIRRELSTNDPKNAQAQRDLGFIEMRTGDVLSRAGQRPAALESYRHALETFQALAARDPSNLLARRDLALIFERLGNLQAAAGNAAGALDNYRRLEETAKEWASRDAANTVASHTLGVARLKISEMQSVANDRAGAAESSRSALEIFEALARRDAENAEHQRGLAWALIRRAQTLTVSADAEKAQNRLRQLQEAAQYYQRSVTLFDQLAKKGGARAEDQRLRQNAQTAIQQVEQQIRRLKDGSAQTAVL